MTGNDSKESVLKESNRVTKKRLKKSLQGTYGNIIAIANKLKVTRGAIYKFLDKNPDMKELVNREREEIVILAENQLAIGMLKGDSQLIRHTLRTKGRDRGWGEKQEIEHSGDIPISINIIAPNTDEMINVTNKQVEYNGEDKTNT